MANGNPYRPFLAWLSCSPSFALHQPSHGHYNGHVTHTAAVHYQKRTTYVKHT